MPARVYRFNELRKSALGAKREISFDKKGPLTDQQKAILERNKAYTLEDVNVAAYLLYSDVNLKGSLAMAYTAQGGGISFSASVNPFGLVGLNTDLDVGAGLKLAQQRSVLVLRGPKAVEVGKRTLTVPKPISITSPIGVYWQGSVQLGINIGFGFEAKAGSSGNADKGVKSKAKAEGVDWGKFGEKDDDVDTSTGYELVAASFEAGVGFKAEGSYTYDHFYAEDPFVISCADYTETEVSLNQILEEGSTKTAIKRRAIDFINKHVNYFGGNKLELHKSYLFGSVVTTTSRDEVLGVLRSHYKRLPSMRMGGESLSLKDQAARYIYWLSLYDRPWDSSAFLRVSAHQAEGKAGLYAGFEGKAQAMGIAALNASAEVFAGMSGGYKRAYARFQTKSYTEAPPTRDGSEGEPLVVFTTYDSAVTYSTFSLGVEFEQNLSGSLGPKKVSLGQTKLGKAIDEGLEKASDALSKKPDSLNRMHYRCAIAVWAKPPPPPRGGKTSEVPLLEGSGLALGGSFVVENLCKLYERRWDETAGGWAAGAAEDPYVGIIVQTVGTSAEDVLAFLADEEVRTHLLYYLPEEMGVLIEATFPVDAGLLVGATHGTHKDDSKVALVQLDKDFGTKLFESKQEVQSMRLRVRKRDEQNKDASLFSIGFKVNGNGMKIKLDKVNRAGADGIFDLRTVYLGAAGKMAEANPSTLPDLYEVAVPPAALFCQ